MTLQIALAFLLDIIIGDPHWFPHPVKGMGKLIVILEKILCKPYLNLRVSGMVLALVVVGVSCSGGFLTLRLAGITGPWLELAVGSFLIFTTLSINDLGKKAGEVYQRLAENNIPSARKKVGRIVGRDTQNLSQSEIVRATVETVAENSVDGIISPLFYAFIGGAPLALAYKAVNTLDSMVGNKNTKYYYLGWFSAKLDDVANFIPARIAALLVPLASFLVMRRGKDSFRIILRDGKKSPSPNAGIPEAGFAGALGIRLGGTNYYKGRKEDRPLIGDHVREIATQDIRDAITLMRVLSLVSFLTFFLAYWAFVRLFLSFIG